MSESKEDFNQTLFKAARGNRANAISKTLFENMEKTKEQNK